MFELPGSNGPKAKDKIDNTCIRSQNGKWDKKYFAVSKQKLCWAICFLFKFVSILKVLCAVISQAALFIHNVWKL